MCGDPLWIRALGCNLEAVLANSTNCWSRLCHRCHQQWTWTKKNVHPLSSTPTSATSLKVRSGAILQKIDCKSKNHLRHLEMPVFRGENPDGWIYQARRFFALHRMSEPEKMEAPIIQSWWRNSSAVLVGGSPSCDSQLDRAQDDDHGAISALLVGNNLWAISVV